jgi:predicted MPP superfamily phosphohydrolase
MSGRILPGYFERMVDEVNALEPDFVAITGDIIEYEKCLSWIPATLGRLRAPNGVHYVLGNHDRKVEEYRLNSALAEAGLQYLGGTYRQLTVRGIPLILAGNEIPWYWPAANLHNCAPHDASGLPLRIVLAHSPDQFRWAQDNDVDLMLAGHLHGGQICLPFFGAICAPSNFGVKYASGIFTAGNTVMHVSRGTGSLTPVRYNCPPEIALLKLRPGSAR